MRIFLRVSIKKTGMDIPVSLLFHVELLLELFYTAASVNELLLSCIEWMACRADIQSDLGLSGHSFKRVATCTGNLAWYVVRMDSFLHVFHLFPREAL